MSIYMKLNGISGNVTATGHNNWIELQSISWGVGRYARTQTGHGNERQIGIPQFGDIFIKKNIDSASPLLFTKACQGRIDGDVIIHFCQTDQPQDSYLEYTLSNTVINSFDQCGSKNSITGQYAETLSIHYGKIMIRFIPRNSENRPMTPISSGYNVITAEAL